MLSAVINVIIFRAVEDGIFVFVIIDIFYPTKLSYTLIIDESNLLKSEIFGDIGMGMIE
jgi:hypothetical protein